MVRETDELYGGILKRMLDSNIVKMGKEGWDQLNSRVKVSKETVVLCRWG